MDPKRITRREAATKLAMVTAAAMGLGPDEIERLAGQIRRVTPTVKLDIDKLAAIKPMTPEGKFLKVIVIAREDIFTNEYGRGAIFDADELTGSTCSFFFNFGNASDANKECSINGCGVQECPELFCSDKNTCGKQSCGKQGVPANTNIFASQVLDRIRTDPFVQALLKEFNVTNTRDLSARITEMVSQRRTVVNR